jgi:hypothetical protein
MPSFIWGHGEFICNHTLVLNVLHSLIEMYASPPSEKTHRLPTPPPAFETRASPWLTSEDTPHGHAGGLRRGHAGVYFLKNRSQVFKAQLFGAMKEALLYGEHC